MIPTHPAAQTLLGLPGFLWAWYLFLAACGLFTVIVVQRFLLLRRGQPDPRWGDWRLRWKGLFLFGILQQRQPRYFWAGLIHYLIFSGFLVLGLRSLDLVIQSLSGGYEPPFLQDRFGIFYNSLKDLFEILVLAACLWAILRRAILRPERYRRNGGHQAEAYLVLGLIAFLMLTDMLFEGGRADFTRSVGLPAAALGSWLLSGLTAPQALVVSNGAFWFHLLAFYSFLNFLPLAKHFHILTALPNVYFRKLKKGSIKPARWGTENLEDLESLGVSRLEDFTWKHLLDFYTCTECGRCSDQCPARAVGRPLSPKMITIKLRDFAYETRPVFSGKAPVPPAGGGDGRAETKPEGPLIGGVLSAEEIWSCTTCGACEEECPVFIEYIDKMIDLRRHLIETAQGPSTFNQVLTHLEKTGNPFGKPPKKRIDWVKDLDGVPVRVLKPGEETEVLYFVDGYGSYDPRLQEVVRAVATGLHRAGVDFAVLGPKEKDTGHQVRRLGEEGLFQLLLEENMETLGKYRFNRIITADPHAFNTLKNDYPGNLPVVHASIFFRDLLQAGRLKPKNPIDSGRIYTYHDPCYLGRHNAVYREPREILDLLPGLTWVEMGRCRDRSFCCGGGDVNLWHEIEGEEMRMAAKRLQMAREAGAGGLITACPFCLLNLEDAAKTAGLDQEMQVIDWMELLVKTL
ncbi:MAG: (Fe-S)-binding protein [Deltaproteobacteria bacterium]|nr:(Fe-S)-binding protein [Deltaproteobacteria bacterium]